MAKRPIAALLVAAALLLIPSCDAEALLRGFGTNVLGGVDTENTVNQVNEQVDLILESGFGNPESYDALVNAVVTASRNPDTEKKMLDSLKADLAEESLPDLKNQVDSFIDEVERSFNITIGDIESGSLDDIKGNIQSSDIPDGLKPVVSTAIDDASKLLKGINDPDSSYKPTKGDVIVLHAASNLITELSEMTGSSGEIESIIETANGSLKLFNTIKSSTVFSNIDLNTVIDALLAEMNQPSEGEEGAV